MNSAYRLPDRLRVLLVDDDQEEYYLLRELLSSRYATRQSGGEYHLDLEWIGSYEKAIELIAKQEHDAYLIDYQLGEHNGLELVRAAHAENIPIPVILLTGHGSYEIDLEAMSAGAYDYLVKGEVTAPLLERAIRYARERKRTEEALRKARDELEVRVQERTRELYETAEEKLRHAARAEALVRVANRLNAKLDLDAVLDAVCAEAVRALNVSAAWVDLFDEEGKATAHARVYGMNPDFWQRFPPLSPTWKSGVHEESERVFVLYDRAKKITHPLASLFRKNGIGFVASAALVSDRRQVGALNLILVGENRQLAKDDFTLLQGMADQALLAINNAGLYKDLQKTLKEEQAMRQQLILAEKHSALSRMVASVAHELNNPIQTIQNCMFLLDQDISEDEPTHEILAMAVSESQRVAKLVAHLREIYRPSKINPVQALNLVSVLEDIQALLSAHLHHQNVTWIQELGSDEIVILGISDQIKQVFLNLGLNAIEAMQPVGGTITIRSRILFDKGEVGITVQDSGPGILPENMEMLFEPFFTTKETGTGLGLSICYDIVQRHQGRIQVESQPGEGAKFTVWLPLAR